jgi:hypothetical protein
LSNAEYEYGYIQKFFIKFCFIFKNINLEIDVPSDYSETVQLYLPKELNEERIQIGSIQYGGIKYPIMDNDSIHLKYVEIRLKGEFLRTIGKYNEIYNLLKENDANDWIKYKFTYCKEDIILARKVANIISRGLEREFGKKYLTIGIDKKILELPRQRPKYTFSYNQSEAVKIISDILIEQGYDISRSSKSNPTYHIIVSSNGKSARILVRNLQHDSAYKDSTIPYQVYKIDAFETTDEQEIGIKEIDFVVGYNFKDNVFACLSIDDFLDKRSRVVHEKEGLRSEFFNSWDLLSNYFSNY